MIPNRCGVVSNTEYGKNVSPFRFEAPLKAQPEHTERLKNGNRGKILYTVRGFCNGSSRGTVHFSRYSSRHIPLALMESEICVPTYL